MAGTVQVKDIEQGTYLLKGIHDEQATRAARRCYVDGLTVNTEANARARLDEAATALVTSLGQFHPDDETLPLQTVNGTYWSSNGAFLDALYYRTGLDNPFAAPFDFAQETLAYTKKEYILRRFHDDNSDGLYVWEDLTEEGTYTWPTTRSIYARKIEVPVTTIIVPAGRLDASHLTTINALRGHTNEDAVTINGVCRAVDTLKFLCPNVRPVRENGTTKYYTNLLFQYLSTGWGHWEVEKQYTVWALVGQDGRFTIEWNVEYDDSWLDSPFADAFPVWDPDAQAVGTGPEEGSCDEGSGLIHGPINMEGG